MGEVLGPHAQLPVICCTEAGTLVYCQGIYGSFVQLHYAQHRPSVAVDLHSRPCEVGLGGGRDCKALCMCGMRLGLNRAGECAGSLRPAMRCRDRQSATWQGRCLVTVPQLAAGCRLEVPHCCTLAEHCAWPSSATCMLMSTQLRLKGVTQLPDGPPHCSARDRQGRALRDGAAWFAILLRHAA